MATLSVLKFASASGAEETLDTIQRLQEQHLIEVYDAAIITWPTGKKKPKTRQLHNLAGAGALEGSFWGLLFGVIFFIPVLGVAVGAAIGALGGALTDVGIDDRFIKETRAAVTEGTSALFLLTGAATIDKVVEALKPHKPQLVSSNLSEADEKRLFAAFAAE